MFSIEENGKEVIDLMSVYKLLQDVISGCESFALEDSQTKLDDLLTKRQDVDNTSGFELLLNIRSVNNFLISIFCDDFSYKEFNEDIEECELFDLTSLFYKTKEFYKSKDTLYVIYNMIDGKLPNLTTDFKISVEFEASKLYCNFQYIQKLLEEHEEDLDNKDYVDGLNVYINNYLYKYVTLFNVDVTDLYRFSEIKEDSSVTLPDTVNVVPRVYINKENIHSFKLELKNILDNLEGKKNFYIMFKHLYTSWKNSGGPKSRFSSLIR